ncbi:MAG: type IX secretion system sortase PorU [Muribaculaceae bacterium]|nr:type IX secretion system sortase PorU [Muribaculaceae bacterium]
MNKNRQFVILGVLCAVLMLPALSAIAFPIDHFAPSSRLSSGRWARVEVDSSGMYVLTPEVIQQMGFSNPAHVHVFGGGCEALSECLNADIVDDLPQVPVVRMGGNVVFYVRGITSWAKTDSMTFKQKLHPYATTGYYFVTEDSTLTDCQLTRSERTPAGQRVSTFTERLFHEEELHSPNSMGANMLGEDFLSRPVNVKFKLTDLVEGSLVSVDTQVGVAIETGTSELRLSCNGTTLPTTNEMKFRDTSDDNFYETVLVTRRSIPGSMVKDTVDCGAVHRIKLQGTDELNLGVELVANGSMTMARLDYVTVNYERRLSMAGANELQFASPDSTSADICYVLDGADEGTRVWDVTVPWSPVELRVDTEGGKAVFSPVAAGHREYIAFRNTTALWSVLGTARVGNQNLHGSPTPDMIIVAPSALQQQADRLAAFHEEHDSLRVLVTTPRRIYNEFSSGTPDILAIRMLCKMMWDRGTDSTGHHLQHLLLMGDGTFDNRELLSETRSLNRNALLVYESAKGFSDRYTFCSDDILAVLGDDSGPKFYYNPLSIAVGRFPVATAEEARIMVDKTIAYATTPDYGVWKTQSLNVADDMDNGFHMTQAEAFVTAARAHGGQDIIFNHVYIDAFPVTTVNSTRTFPEAKTLMLNKLKEGVLWWNYTGHASPNNWGAEGMLRRSDITSGLYYDHLPVLFAAACSFGKFDNYTESGAENMVLNERGGTVASFAATREVLSTQNGYLNEAMGMYLFTRDTQGRTPCIGEALRLAKNDMLKGNDRSFNKSSFVLLGDPALRLPVPSYRAVIESINGEPVRSTNLPVFQGRQTVTFSGYICDQQGNKQPQFNGMVRSTLFDSEQSITTNGYEIKGEYGRPVTYLDRTNRLALSVDTVSSGTFNIKMTIPSELLATYENFSPSLLNLYAYDEDNRLEASGSCSDFYIYGYDDTTTGDTEGPEITFLGLNSTSFVDGDAVNDSPIVLASISDASGLNFSTAGIGHEMTLLLDGNKSYNDITGYYTPQQTSVGTLGTLRFPLSDLEAGEHSLRLRVWDVHCNMNERTIHFNVSPSLKPDVVDVYTTSNPAYTSTTFYVEHNRPESVLQVTIEVFDLMGRLVWSTTQSGKSKQFMSFPITWDLTRTGGGRVQRGIYVFRATITADGGEHESSKAKKIAIGDE